MTIATDEPPFGLRMPSDLFCDDAECVVLEYARRLAGWAGAKEFPRSMSAIAERLKHRVSSAPLPVGLRGVRVAQPRPLILTSDEETRAAQERTVAHEIFHPFVGVEHHEYTSTRGKVTPLQARAEMLCDIGAAELHMPVEEMQRQMRDAPAIRDVPRFAEYFGASLAATLRSMVAATPFPIAGVTFELRHKPTDRVPSATGQQVLWGSPADFDAPKRLRVHDWSVSQGISVRFNHHQHVDEGTSIHSAYLSGAETSGWDDLTSIGLPAQRYRTESWPHRYKNTTRVLTLVWLDRTSDFAKEVGPSGARAP